MNAMKRKRDFKKVGKGKRLAKNGLWITQSAMPLKIQKVGMDRKVSAITAVQQESIETETEMQTAKRDTPVNTMQTPAGVTFQSARNDNLVTSCPKLLNPLLHTGKVEQQLQKSESSIERRLSRQEPSESIPMTNLSLNHVGRIVH